MRRRLQSLNKMIKLCFLVCRSPCSAQIRRSHTVMPSTGFFGPITAYSVTISAGTSSLGYAKSPTIRLHSTCQQPCTEPVCSLPQPSSVQQFTVCRSAWSGTLEAGKWQAPCVSTAAEKRHTPTAIPSLQHALLTCTVACAEIRVARALAASMPV